MLTKARRTSAAKDNEACIKKESKETRLTEYYGNKKHRYRKKQSSKQLELIMC